MPRESDAMLGHSVYMRLDHGDNDCTAVLSVSCAPRSICWTSVQDSRDNYKAEAVYRAIESTSMTCEKPLELSHQGLFATIPAS